MRRFVAALAGAGLLFVARPAAAAPPPAADPAASLPAPSAVPGLPFLPTTSPALVGAQRAAAALQARVAALEARTEQTVEHFNEVATALKVAANRHTQAAQAWVIARAGEVYAKQTADARARALYIHGGAPGLAALTIDSSQYTLLDRYDDARFVLQQDNLRLAAAAEASSRTADAERVLAAALADQQRLAQAAAAARRAVEARLAAQRALLTSATGQVQALLASRTAAENRATAALTRMVLDARRAAGGSGVAFSGRAPLSPLVRIVLAAAETELGKPYRWGATGPSSYDCSGLVQYAFAVAGVPLPRTSREQWYVGTHPPVGDLRPGDLLFWGTDTTNPLSIHHVAIYLGDGYMIAAPHTGALVRVQPVYANGFFGVTRIDPANDTR